MESVVAKAISVVQDAEISYCKFTTPNDTGQTGSHQAGYHLHKDSWPLFFDSPGKKGLNKDRLVTIKWQDDFETESRFIYYGVGTRDEYRLTRFGRGFPYLQDDNVGDLVILSRVQDYYFEGFVLQTEEDIEEFLAAFGLSPAETNRIIQKSITLTPTDKLLQCFLAFIKSLSTDFPPTQTLATSARNCYMKALGIHISDIRADPDRQILEWIEAEYRLFKTIETDRYGKRIKTPFASVEELIVFANTILNRRKSRAGKSLEHHLTEIFRIFEIPFSSQAMTEGKKRPDFIFPSIEAYHNTSISPKQLTFLASKTTCKDRWRQVLNEADRIRTKHLFTLQQGISNHQLREMYKYGIRLVVPKIYKSTFPKEFRPQILSLEQFIGVVQSKT